MGRLRCHSLSADIDKWAFRSSGVNHSSSCCGVRLIKPKLSSGMASWLLWLPYEESSTLWKKVIYEIHYTIVAISNAEVTVTSAFSISSDKNAKPGITISVLAKFSQHRAQTLAPEVWLISATVFHALLKTVTFIFFLACSELFWNLLGPPVCQWEWNLPYMEFN